MHTENPEMDPIFSHPNLSQKSEQLGQLCEEWLDKIYDTGYFKLFVPEPLGGLGLSLPQGLKVEEELSKADGSLGWTVTLCAGAAWFVGFLDPELSKEIFADTKVCLAGSGHVGGKAELIGEEYHVHGQWSYTSGALHASHFTANCEIIQEGKNLLDQMGKPVVRAFILRREEIKILDGWSYMGMLATGSHAFKAENVRIPRNRCFEILPDKVTLAQPIYRYPFLQFAEATLAVNILGISWRLQELIAESFWKRNETRNYGLKHLKYFLKQEKLTGERLNKAKEKFYSKVSDSWNELEKEGKISKKTLKSVSKASRKLTFLCRELNAKMYPFAGLEAAKTHTELNRVWRDFNTVSQHALLIFPF